MNAATPLVLVLGGFAGAFTLIGIYGHVWVSGGELPLKLDIGSLPETKRKLRPPALGLSEELHLTVKIIEAFVVPEIGTAKCFLQLSIHNDSGVECSNPLRFALSLRIDGKDYSFTSRLNLHDYQLTQYKIVENYGEDGAPYESERVLAQESLRPNVLGEKNYLLKGKPLVGWLGVEVHHLPA